MHTTALQIVRKLHRAGFDALYAGGCVRDLLLRRTPSDIDIATNARPDEIERVLASSKIIPVGRAFGVMMVIEDGHRFEIATFRSDSGYSDGRRPDAVSFTNAKEDAARRDFTINGMFYDPVTREVRDYFGGSADLKARLIRFIGDPEKRILEDHLRILRAIRFKVKFKFQYHPDTYQAIVKHAHLVKKVSAERIRDELHKMLCYPNRVQALHDLSDTGLLALLLPELEAMKGVAQPYQYHQEGDVWEHMLKSVKSLTPQCPIDVIWATVLHDSGKPDTFKLGDRIRFDGHVNRSGEIAESLLKRLRYNTEFVQKVAWLCREHMLTGNIVAMAPLARLKWFRHPWFADLLRVAKADAEGAIPVDLKLYRRVRSMYLKAKKSMPKRLRKLVSGEDVMQLCGMEAGPHVGSILEKIVDAQLSKKVKTRKQALALAEKLCKHRPVTPYQRTSTVMRRKAK